MDISLNNKTVLVTGAAGFIGAFHSEELEAYTRCSTPTAPPS